MAQDPQPPDSAKAKEELVKAAEEAKKARVAEEHDHDYQMKIWDAYISRRKMLDAAHLTISDRYSNWLITIAGGALGISLTFLEKFAPNPRASTLWLIAFAWIFLTLSLLGAFIAIFCSGNAIQRQLALADYKHRKYRKSQDPTLPEVAVEREDDKWSAAIPKIDVVSVISLVLGLFFLFAFSFSNFPSRKKHGKPEPTVVELRVAGPKNHGDHVKKEKITEIKIQGGKIELLTDSYVPRSQDLSPPQKPKEGEPQPSKEKANNDQKPKN